MKIVEMFKGIPAFLKDVQMEIKRTSFPSKDEVKDTTMVVIVVCVLFGVFLWIVDQVIFTLIQELLKRVQ